MTKEEMKNRISMALKDPTLQQGFEVICKENAEQSEIDNVNLFKAIGIIKKLLKLWNEVMTEESVKELVKEANQFISEVEKCKNPYLVRL